MTALQGSVASMVSDDPTDGLSYPGLVTRGIAFALDAAVINVVATVVGVGASLILSLLHLPSDVKTILAAIGTAAYVLWLVGYFVVFWSTTGQTPGARMMQIKVQGWDGCLISPHRALVRCGGLFLAALPLFLGFVPILYDDKRRGFQDRFAGTVVINAPAVSMIEARRARKREQYLGLRAHDDVTPHDHVTAHDDVMAHDHVTAHDDVTPETEATMEAETRAAQASSEPRSSPPELFESLGHDDPSSRFEQGEM